MKIIPEWAHPNIEIVYINTPQYNSPTHYFTELQIYNGDGNLFTECSVLVLVLLCFDVFTQSMVGANSITEKYEGTRCKWTSIQILFRKYN